MPTLFIGFEGCSLGILMKTIAFYKESLIDPCEMQWFCKAVHRKYHEIPTRFIGFEGCRLGILMKTTAFYKESLIDP